MSDRLSPATLDDYAGPFEPGFALDRLTRAALGKLGREYMLFAHLHDRGLMPLVAARFGPGAMTDVACDEWIGASPVYNERNRRQLGVPGDGVSAILKALQVDVGFPHEYMDVRYQLVDDTLGYFALPFCGAYQDVFKFSRGSEAAIHQLCHEMEDTTFDATVMAVNPLARCRPEHRPPLQIGHAGPTCRWRVFLDDEAATVPERAVTRAVRATGAAGFAFAPLEPVADGGLEHYAGAFETDFALESLSHPVLARQCREFALDTHLLMRAAFLSIRTRWGDAVAREISRDHQAAVAPVAGARVRAALGIEGDGIDALLKTLQVDPAFPHEYVRLGCERVDDRRGRFWIERCTALAEDEPDAWLALLDDERPGFEAALVAVNPRARCRPLAPESIDAEAQLAWEIEIDPSAQPRPESPMANAVRASNAASFVFRDAAER